MTIAEVSERFELSADTLRYYEKIGLTPKVKRTQGGIRSYSEEDCRWIEFIKCMRGAGLPVEVLIEYVSLFQQGDATVQRRKAILMHQRDLLAERMEAMQLTLERLNAKIDRYEDGLALKENSLTKQGEKIYE